MLTHVIFVPSIPQHFGRPPWTEKWLQALWPHFVQIRLQYGNRVLLAHSTLQKNKQTNTYRSHTAVLHLLRVFTKCVLRNDAAKCHDYTASAMSMTYWWKDTERGKLQFPAGGGTNRSATSSFWDRTRASAVTASAMVQHMTQQIGHKKSLVDITQMNFQEMLQSKNR